MMSATVSQHTTKCRFASPSSAFRLTEEVGVTATLEEDTDGGEEDRKDDLDDIGALGGLVVVV